VDPRIEAYAKLLVERSLDVQPGWQVWINSSPLGRPLVEEVVRLIARRGAYPLVRLGGAGMEDVPFETIWALEAPEDALAEVAPADRHAWETMDAWMNIGAPENTASGAELSPERRALLAKARHPMRTRRLSDEIPWVACRFPTPALAQDSRMSLAEFEDFLYGACLLDWEEEGRKMRRIADRFDAASEVRFQQLRQQRIRIGSQDLKIASVALEHNLAVRLVRLLQHGRQRLLDRLAVAHR